MRLFRSIACRPQRDPRAAGITFLASATAFLGVAFLGGQESFIGVGFAFLGLGIALIARGRRDR